MFRILCICLILLFALPALAQLPSEYFVYIGTYTDKTGSEGIYSYRFNRHTGEIAPIGLAAKTPEPSFLAVARSGKFLYAVNETAGGEVSAFRIQPDGKLAPLNTVASKGGHPAHISIDTTGRNLLVANYSGGNVAAFRTNLDGTLTEAISVAQHSGSSVNPERQKAPHAHAIIFAPGEKQAVAADLGTDHLYIYNVSGGRLERAGAVKLKSGAGPRHLAFHPKGLWLYAINELDSTITVMDWVRGSLQVVDSFPTLPPDFDSPSWTAEIVIHPSGKFLYASNRGHDSIAVFSIGAGAAGTKGAVDGRIDLIEFMPTGGKRPRNFALDPSGQWLFAANQDSGTVVVFKVDQNTGRLTNTGTKIEVPSPVCVRFVPVRK